MSESPALFWSIATAVPAILIVGFYLLWFARLARRLQSAHPAVWIGLGRPGSSDLLKPWRSFRLLAWVSSQSYLRLRNQETIALGMMCRRVYFLMLAVAVWILAVMVIGPAESP
jgi:hypothetical protein